ncbi:NTP transferase domain-containing protein [Domibacillus robiginosus]|uniref:NTP transferase domain-containing protein n=1 Tax=Domibacillus robiginosus TaxID=1071054 RepID=UPI00067DDD0C|nr:NTP transferase domain-containing protein [Domibacillus robiginosus]
MNERIVGVLLAAGSSRRMGGDKLALPLGHTTIGGASLETALSSSLDHTIVIGRKDSQAAWIPPSLFERKGWSYAVCDEAFYGQAYTLAFGLKAAEQMNAQGVMVLLGDQPFVGVELINQIINTYKKINVPFVAARLDGIPRPPVLFSNRCFPVLKQLKGDRGAGNLLKQLSFARQGRMVDYKESRPFFDIDTMQEYEQVVRRGWDGYTNTSADIGMAARESGGSPLLKGRA